MTDYTKLVQALRCKSLSKECDSCAYGYHLSSDSECNDACHVEQIISDAADAIEALNRLLDQNTQRCEALRNQLREAHESYERHLNELEAQLPKRGEWVDGDARRVTARCSVCGHLRLGNGAEWANKHVHFCEVCGSRMGGEKE